MGSARYRLGASIMMCISQIHRIRPAVAAYRWTRNDGLYSFSLCASCTGWWMVCALMDDSMMPRAVELIADPSPDFVHGDV